VIGVAIRKLFAEQPVNLSKLPSFRAEYFPQSGPHPWLDGPGAFDRIEKKLHEGAVSEEEAQQFRFWAANGYVVLRNLIEDQILDEVWDAYEKAIRSGRIVLQPEAAGEDDPYPPP